MGDSLAFDPLPQGAVRIRHVDRWLERRCNWITCTAAVLVLQGLLVVTHQAWLDEWQALQIAVQSPTLSSLLDNLRYEGHPPLWYALLRTAATVLPTNWVLPAVQLPIALALQALILFRLPLRRSERLLWACNPFVLIDYGAMARSLGLGVLLFLAAVHIRERRRAYFIIALLPMADFLFGVLSIAVLIILWRERRLWRPGILVWLVCCVASAWCVRPAPDIVTALAVQGAVTDAVIELARFGTLVLPLAFADGQLVWNQLPSLPAALAGGMFFLCLGFWLLRGDRLAQGIFAGFVALLFAFSMFVYPLAIRHVSLAAALLVSLFAILRDGDNRHPPIFTAWLFVGACCGISSAIVNLVRPFDVAPRAATFMINHHLETKHWAAFPDSRAQGVSALTGVEFEQLEQNCTGSFVRWNHRTGINSVIDLEHELDRIAARSGSFYLLTDFDLLARAHHKTAYRQLLAEPPGIDGQPFFLYQVHPELPESSQPLARCAPKRSPMRPTYVGSPSARHS